MFKKIWKWAAFRHNKKNRNWIKEKYFKSYGNDNWRFMTNKIILIKHSEQIIKQHIKVQGTKTPYDGDWIYWGNRLKKMPDKPSIIINLLKLQQGKCNYCKLWFKSDDKLKIHHKDQNKHNYMSKNLSLLHWYC